MDVVGWARSTHIPRAHGIGRRDLGPRSRLGIVEGAHLTRVQARTRFGRCRRRTCAQCGARRMIRHLRDRLSGMAGAPGLLGLGLACWVTPSVAWADGGCSGCFDSSGCVWVCVVVLSVVAIPLWLVGLAGTLAFEPRLRRARPHLVALPLAYVGAWFTVVVLQTGGAAIASPLPLVAWYALVLRMPALASFRRRR